MTWCLGMELDGDGDIQNDFQDSSLSNWVDSRANNKKWATGWGCA